MVLLQTRWQMVSGNKKKELGLGIGFAAGMGIVICGVVVIWFIE